jgi:predicted amidohydrolase
MALRVAAVQHDIVWEDRDATLARLQPRLEAAAAAGAGLIVLPETFAVGFSMRTDVTAEPYDGPTATWMGERAAALGAWVGGSVPERAVDGGRPRNVFVLAGPGGERHRYAKRHLFRYGHEDDAFAVGDEPPITVDVGGVRVSPVVCYDLRFGNQLWDQAAATDCFVVVANWPVQRHLHWRALLLARAIEDQCYVVGVNRVGPSGDGVGHLGGSCIIDPRGTYLADAEPQGEVELTLVAEVDPAEVTRVRARFPFLEDRRPGAQPQS